MAGCGTSGVIDTGPIVVDAPLVVAVTVQVYGSSQVSGRGTVQYGTVSVPELTVRAGQVLPGSGWQVSENW